MADRTYLFGYGSGPWGSSSRKTKTEILTNARFAAVNPEVMRRLFAIADAVIDKGSDLGFGGGTRYFAEQDAEFRRRHYIAPTGIWFYDGHWWQRYDWAAPYAPPGNSWHEQGASTKGAMAVDMLGDHAMATPLCAAHGLVNGISGEAWHYQAIEIPHARAYKLVWGELPVWPLPNVPTPPPPTPGGPVVADKFKFIADTADDKLKRPFDAQVGSTPVTIGIVDPDAAGAVGVVVNLTADAHDLTTSGFVKAWAAGAPEPPSSKLNWVPGQIEANEVTVRLDGFGRFVVSAQNPVRLVVDVVGYWMP